MRLGVTMRSSLPPRTIWIGSDAARRFRVAMWAIAQTAAAAGLAWWIARDVLGHVLPFFAPIAAAVCLWATNVVRAEIAADLVIGVAVGIAIGTGVHALLGDGPIAMATVVLLSLWVAVTIAQGFTAQKPMFVNQTVMSAILILAFANRGFGLERLSDALIGGGLAVVFSIVFFPKNPLTVLGSAHRAVLAELREILAQIGCRTGDPLPAAESDWALVTAARLHQRLAELAEARSTAGQLACFCPRRWPLRGATRTADARAAQLALLATSVLHLARIATTSSDTDKLLADPLRDAIEDLGAAVAALEEGQPAVAAAQTASVRSAFTDPRLTALAGAQALLPAVIATCADELQRTIELS